MITIPPALQKLAIVAALCGACWVGGCTHERMEQRAMAAHSEALADVKVEGLERELKLSKQSGEKAVAFVADVLGSELDRVRNRPPRRVEVIKSGSCEGVTGAQLSGSDAEFLSREAARAERIRVERDEIAGMYNSLVAACLR